MLKAIGADEPTPMDVDRVESSGQENAREKESRKERRGRKEREAGLPN